MSTTIQIPLEPELAEVYERTSRENQRKLQMLVRLWLRDIDSADPARLSKLMDDISDRATARGLTPEILESLLNDEE